MLLTNQLLKKHSSNSPAMFAGDQTITFGEVAEAVHQHVALLRAWVRPGYHVCLAMENCFEWIVNFFSAVACGASVSTVNPSFTAHEILNLHKFVPFHCIIAPDMSFPGFVSMGANSDIHVYHDVETLFGEVVPSGILHQYSSGTTGVPKRVVRTEENLLYEAQAVAQVLEVTDSDRILCTAPLFHAYGFGVGLLAGWYVGAPLIIQSPKSGRQLHDLVSATGCTVIVSVAPLYDLWSYETAKNHYLRLCVSAGSYLAVSIRQRFHKRWGLPIRIIYGMTECGVITILNEDKADDRAVGYPISGVNVEVDAGEIVVSGPSLGTVYDGNQLRPLTNDRLYTGDLGWIDEDGCLYLKGRRSRLINVYGEKVDPQEVELVLRQVPFVKDVYVIGYTPSMENHYQYIVAFIVESEPTTDEMFWQVCADHLASYKHPRRIVRLLTLPRSKSGKVIEYALLKILSSER